MSRFRRENYDLGAHHEFEPVYADDLFRFIVRYRGSEELKLAVDVATGTGQVARSLRDGKGGLVVQRVIGFDASDKLLSGAREAEKRRSDKQGKPDVDYRVCNAEKLDLPDTSVDLLTVGQGAHWFDMPEFWKEAARVLKPGGTLAMFAFAVPVLPGNAEASQLILQLEHGDHYLGPYWEEPGRTFTQELYIDDMFIPPSDLFTRQERHVQTGDEDDSTLLDAPLLSATMTLSQLAGYLKAGSAYTNWKRQHLNAEHDIVDECIKKMRACIETEHVEAEKLAGSMFLVPEKAFNPVIRAVWPMVLILAERK